KRHILYHKNTEIARATAKLLIFATFFGTLHNYHPITNRETIQHQALSKKPKRSLPTVYGQASCSFIRLRCPHSVR
ncbi:MAG: hypothetical protein IIW31_05630, partial [Clostridia bacterium]|nr:hypothetical protein [Clostridia bacterium]